MAASRKTHGKVMGHGASCRLSKPCMQGVLAEYCYAT